VDRIESMSDAGTAIKIEMRLSEQETPTPTEQLRLIYS
jgi:hypothetical protein